MVDLWGNDPQARHCKYPSRPVRKTLNVVPRPGNIGYQSIILLLN